MVTSYSLQGSVVSRVKDNPEVVYFLVLMLDTY